jgi:NAD+ synthase (glutamine-hydrolysing)
MFGFFRLAAAVPKLRVADVDYNAAEIIGCFRRAAQEGAAAVVCPELSVTGYTCGDLFFQSELLLAARRAALKIAAATAGSETTAIFGLPLRYDDAIYNVAAVAQQGRIRGLVPKTYLPNYREFYEKRQFKSGGGLRDITLRFDGADYDIPFGDDLLFGDGGEFRFGIEICEDLWSVVPPSSHLALAGAKVIFNLSAGTELAAKAAYRRELVGQQSARCIAAYLLASAGVHESTSDAVFGGHALIAENGRPAAENRRFDRESNLIFADVDLERLTAARMSESSFNDAPRTRSFRAVALEKLPGSPDFKYAFNPPRPFVPPEAGRRERCREILDIQAAGLAKRLEHTGAKKLVIGVSGGLDSTLALLVAFESCRLLGRPASDIVAVTMPGFGTTGRTRGNSETLCRALGADFREIDICESCELHFDNIGHDPAKLDVTYENVQARERTQILMNLANAAGGLVIGTGDLSEIALGWNTYNGDHMSMYAVNASVPKTLIRYLIAAVAADAPPELAAVLADVLDTPVSPELLPPRADGTIAQETEELIGPYELHDFFLYHFIKYGASPAKLLALAVAAFAGVYTETLIDGTLRKFLRRFFALQFKRNCMPDGPKVGTIALSPRGDWRMPSDASDALFRL